MGRIEVKNSLLSKKLKRTDTRLLIIDDNQIRYNQILEIFQSKSHPVQALLLDDLKSFEKQIQTSWDIVIFGQAYDLKFEQALTLIQASQNPHLPVVFLQNSDLSANQYHSFIHKGLYDVLDLKNVDYLYIGLLRALSLSRALQTQQHLTNELETAQNQAQALVQETHKAVAILQEGMHAEANADYLELFGIQSEDEILGFPILDILQPEDLNEFKQRFKKISQGQFEQAGFEIISQNVKASSHNPLKIEFLPGKEDDTLQLTIDTGYATTQSAATPLEQGTTAQINRVLINQPAKANALVLFSLTQCPNEIFQSNWGTTKAYFNAVQSFLKEQTNSPVIKIEPALFIIIVQAESDSVLNSRLNSLNSLLKPQLLTVEQNSYPLQLKAGYHTLDSQNLTESIFDDILANAFNNALPMLTSASDAALNAALTDGLTFDLTPPSTATPIDSTNIELAPSFSLESAPLSIDPSLNVEPEAITFTAPSHEPSTTESVTPATEATSLDFAPIETAKTEESTQITAVEPEETESIAFEAAPKINVEPTLQSNSPKAGLLYALKDKLAAGEIHLKYQQLYDKEDSTLYTYEVTSGFILDNQWKSLANLHELNDDIELAVKLDRWIMVEASKQLHNFITQHPEAKLAINLNSQILYHDKQLPELVAKLITIIGSTQKYPLILQFDQDELFSDLGEAQKQIAELRKHGAEIAVRNFGLSAYSDTLLKRLDINQLSLHPELTALLSTDKGFTELQAKIDAYNEVKPLEMLLTQLNDMNSFASAWNVNARFLQGDYFQKKLDNLIDGQDH